MKKKIFLILSIVAILIAMLVFLTGCGDKETSSEESKENNDNDITSSDVSNEENNDNNNQQNSVENEISTPNNNQQDGTKNETTTTNNSQQNSTKKETSIPNNNQQNSIKNETSTPNNNQQNSIKNETSTSENQNQSVNETTQKKTFNVGAYVLHYGKYEGSCNKLIETSIVNATITINLKEDGTYTYVSTNQEVSKNRAGNYKVKGNTIVLNAEETLDYIVLGEDYFVEGQGGGLSFTYQGS